MKTVNVTLLYAFRENQILLAEKKRGWRQGILNGVGGKLERGETFEGATIRETREEIGITPTKLGKVAVHNFIWFKNELSNMVSHTYFAPK